MAFDEDGTVAGVSGSPVFPVAEIMAWRDYNFGATACGLTTLGCLIEEVGEIARAAAKDKAGVRGTHEEWMAEMRKESGDTFVVLVGVAQLFDFELMADVWCRWADYHKKKPAKNTGLSVIASLSLAASKIALAADRYDRSEGAARAAALRSVRRHTAKALIALGAVAEFYDFDLVAAGADHWAVLRHRDWVADPQGHGLPAHESLLPLALEAV